MECKFSKSRNWDEGGCKIEWSKDRFEYLGSIIHKNGNIEENVNYSIRATWMKWRSTSRLLWERRKFYKTATRPDMLYGIECWAINKEHIH